MMGTQTEERFASLHHRDSATNLDPTHFRMYSSDEARWLTPDPAQADIYNPQSMSRYAYAMGSPTNGIDPWGLWTHPCLIDGHQGICTTSFGLPPSIYQPQYPGCVAYGTEGCIQPPCGIVPGVAGCPQIYTTSTGGGPYIGPAPQPTPPKIGSQPPPPSPPGTTSAYLQCVASVGINMAFGNSDRFFATIGFNLAPIIFSGAPAAAITATFFAGVYDVNLALRVRAICTKEVYGGAR